MHWLNPSRRTSYNSCVDRGPNRTRSDARQVKPLTADSHRQCSEIRPVRLHKSGITSTVATSSTQLLGCFLAAAAFELQVEERNRTNVKVNLQKGCSVFVWVFALQANLCVWWISSGPREGLWSLVRNDVHASLKELFDFSWLLACQRCALLCNRERERKCCVWRFVFVTLTIQLVCSVSNGLSERSIHRVRPSPRSTGRSAVR